MTWKQCVCGWSAAADLDTCGHYLCELHARGFAELVLVDEGESGHRHYLHGEPVHCGSGLILQPNWEHCDPGTRPARVRYEAQLSPGAKPAHWLYTSVAGHEVAVRGCAGQLLRWPHRSRS